MRKIILVLFILLAALRICSADEPAMLTLTTIEGLGTVEKSNAMFDVPLIIPEGSEILRVDISIEQDLVSQDGATSFTAIFSPYDTFSKSREPICTGLPLRYGTKVYKLYGMSGNPDITTMPTKIRIVTDMGKFDLGGRVKVSISYIAHKVEEKTP